MANALTKQWCRQRRPLTRDLLDSLRSREFPVNLGCEIFDVNSSTVKDRTTDDVVTADRNTFYPHTRGHGHGSMRGNYAKDIAIDSHDLRIAGLAKPGSIFCNHIQHRLNVRRRTSDDAQDFSRRRFPFSTFGKFSLIGFKLLSDALQFFFELAQFGSARTLFLL
jgi:hypothetical protein